MIELIEPETAAVSEYLPVEAGLAELRRKYANVAVDVSTPKALAEATKVRAEIREPRYECEKIRKRIKAPALAFAKLIDTEAARITAELLAIETPWDSAIKAEEARKEQEKAEIERKERARVADIRQRIANIEAFVGLALECRTSAMVQALLVKLNDGAHCTPSFDEFEQQAIDTMVHTKDRMVAIRDAKIAEETERERIKAEQATERDRLAQVRAELDQQRRAQAERDRLAADKQRAAQELLDAAQRDLQAESAELARQREAFLAQQAAPIQASTYTEPAPYLVAAVDSVNAMPAKDRALLPPSANEMTEDEEEDFTAQKLAIVNLLEDPTEAIGRPSDADIAACCVNALFDHYGMFPPESKRRLTKIHWAFFEKN